jgi:hypothetical protein
MAHAFDRPKVNQSIRCGSCESIRKQLEEKIAETNFDPSINIENIRVQEVPCHRIDVFVRPLENGCYLWRPARNPKTIRIVYKWIKDQEF